MGPDGFYPLNCKRRSCPVCGPRRSRELARVLYLDAMSSAPTHGVTVTTRDPISAATFREAMAAVVKRLRRHYGQVEYFALVEFTTGRAARSGGRRRIHAHMLTKGLPIGDELQVEQLVRETWRASTGAFVVEVAALRAPAAAIGYVGLHHRKPEQAVPEGWRGMVERYSRGYFSEPIAALRVRARAELRAEAIAWAKELPAELARLEVELERERWAEHRARVIQVHQPRPDVPLLIPGRELHA